MICPNHLHNDFREGKPCERCIQGSKWNCSRHNCIHDSKVKSLLGSVEAILYKMLRTYRLVDLYICPSAFLEKKLLNGSDLYRDKTLAVHNFIERKLTPEKKQEEEPYFAFAGRLSKEKGIDLLRPE